MFPAALHLPQRISVCVIASGDSFLQMLVLRLDDLIGVISVVSEVTRPAQFPTCHGLHKPGFLLEYAAVSRTANG